MTQRKSLKGVGTFRPGVPRPSPRRLCAPTADSLRGTSVARGGRQRAWVALSGLRWIERGVLVGETVHYPHRLPVAGRAIDLMGDTFGENA